MQLAYLVNIILYNMDYFINDNNIKLYFLFFSMSNDCTFVNNLTKKMNYDNIDDNSSEMMYKKITDYQLNIKVEGKS